MNLELITIEKTELVRLINESVRSAVAEALAPRDEMLTKSEAAKYLKKSHSTITRMMKAGLPHHGNGHPTFIRSELDAWLARN